MKKLRQSIDSVGDVLIWWRSPIKLAMRCGCCGGTGCHASKIPEDTICVPCDSVGWIGFEADSATTLRGGEKTASLQYRYQKGEELFRADDAEEINIT